MRSKMEVLLVVAVAAFAISGVIAVTFLDTAGSASGAHDPVVVPTGVAPIGADGLAVAWFQQMRPFCNAVDVETHIRWTPPPEGSEGAAHAAACLALAGSLDHAREMILSLPEDQRWRAAGVVFGAGHPAADAGDDLAAGPLMELVVEFWPNHYQALYHAGAARFEKGEPALAKGLLERFLENYDIEDGWSASARGMLAEIG